MNIREYRPSDRDACLDAFRSNIPKFFLLHELDSFVDHLAKHASTNQRFGFVETSSFIVMTWDGRFLPTA
jgi:hypothetical protein